MIGYPEPDLASASGPSPHRRPGMFADAIREQAARISSGAHVDVELSIAASAEALRAQGRDTCIHLIGAALGITAENAPGMHSIVVTVKQERGRIIVDARTADSADSARAASPEAERLFFAAMAATAAAVAASNGAVLIYPPSGSLWTLDLPCPADHPEGDVR